MSAVPWVISVGILTFDSSVSGPWAANQARSAGAITPVAVPLTQVLNTCGSSRDSSGPSGSISPPGTERALEAEAAQQRSPTRT